jgi:trans-aconitate 2-methyltransferase
MAWDPKTYLKFGAQRTRPAAELLARVDVETPERVADLGCGPGNSTALLAARWPQTDITGVDSSPEMLAAARKSGVDAVWCEADVATWSPGEPCDVIFSNATLQWVPDHRTLLPRLMECVAPGGMFAMQVPRNFGEPGHTLILDVAKGKNWAHKFDDVRNWHHVFDPEDYFDVLEPHAAAIDIWETRYVQVLEGEDAVFNWMSGTGLRPFAQALDDEERSEFLADYRAAVARAYPRRDSGVTLFPFQRLFLVARARG